MITGKTQSGFEYRIDDTVSDDYELLELMGAVRGGDTLAIFELVERLLGKEQKDKLKEHCRDEDGKVKISRMSQEIVDIFSGSDVKKS